MVSACVPTSRPIHRLRFMSPCHNDWPDTDRKFKSCLPIKFSEMVSRVQLYVYTHIARLTTSTANDRSVELFFRKVLVIGRSRNDWQIATFFFEWTPSSSGIPVVWRCLVTRYHSSCSQLTPLKLTGRSSPSLSSSWEMVISMLDVDKKYDQSHFFHP